MEMYRQCAASKKVAELYGGVKRRAGASPHGLLHTDQTTWSLAMEADGTKEAE